jgi:hypothetical protein
MPIGNKSAAVKNASSKEVRAAGQSMKALCEINSASHHSRIPRHSRAGGNPH